MNTKKAFTLVELLAVITILGLMLVIVFPSIVRQLKKSEDVISETTKELIYAATRSYIDKNSNDYQLNNNNVFCIQIQTLIDERELEANLIDVKTGNKIDTNLVVKAEIENRANIDYDIVKSSECDEVRGEIAYKDKSGANIPVLSTGMIPVKWSGSDWVETTIYDSEWYDYTTKKWANVITKDANGNITGYFVWIPRYAYKITSGFHSNETGTIDVKFLNGKTNNSVDGTKVETSGYEVGVKDTSMHYFLHPSFTFGEDQIGGFWVAKFEATAAEGVATITGTCNAADNVATKTVNILPNKTSWRCITHGNAFETSFNMKNKVSVYGWNASEVDTHMMKNDEWGAVAYLSKSIYGVNEEEIWNNSYNQYETGCSGSVVDGSNEPLCIEYNDIEKKGPKASTTGNVYGVYDMSGGAWERVAAYVNNGDIILETNGASLLNEEDIKYKNVYEPGNPQSQVTNYAISASNYGDAIWETSSSHTLSTSWYGDYSNIPHTSVPFFSRGGYYNSATNAGVFSFGNSTGGGVSNAQSFRPVVINLK